MQEILKAILSLLIVMASATLIFYSVDLYVDTSFAKRLLKTSINAFLKLTVSKDYLLLHNTVRLIIGKGDNVKGVGKNSSIEKAVNWIIKELHNTEEFNRLSNGNKKAIIQLLENLKEIAKQYDLGTPEALLVTEDGIPLLEFLKQVREKENPELPYSVYKSVRVKSVNEDIIPLRNIYIPGHTTRSNNTYWYEYLTEV